MSRFAAVSSQRDVRGWQSWRGFFTCFVVGVLLLVIEQAHVGGFLWNLARWTTIPGIQSVRTMEQSWEQTKVWWNWRGFVTTRLAESENDVSRLSQRVAELTQELQASNSSELNASQTLDKNQSQPTIRQVTPLTVEQGWVSTSWEGIPGAWQIRLGCQKGVRVGSPVVTANGVLLGVVSQARRDFSTVMAWDNSDFSLAVRVGTTSAVALLRGGPDSVQIQSLRWPSPVTPGDAILSAGSEFIPRDLSLGSLQTLAPMPEFAEAQGSVLPPSDLHQERDVFVRVTVENQTDSTALQANQVEEALCQF